MPLTAWLAVDVALVVIALLVLAALSITLWRQISTLSRDLRRIAERITDATSKLATAVEPLQHRR